MSISSQGQITRKVDEALLNDFNFLLEAIRLRCNPHLLMKLTYPIINIEGSFVGDNHSMGHCDAQHIQISFPSRRHGPWKFPRRIET